MTAALLRVSVVGGGRRLDLAVPPALPVAELVPGLARRLGLVAYDGLRLCTATGSVLDDADGLAPQHVADGAVLTLAPPPAPPVVHDDLPEALARAAPPARPPRGLAAAGASLLLLLGAASSALAGGTRPALVAALVLLAGGLALGRSAVGAAVVATAAACGFAAVAAWLFVADLALGPGAEWAASGGGALAVASVAMTGLPSGRLRLLPVLVVAVAAAAVGAVLALRSVSLPVVAAVLLTLDVLLTAAVPWVAAGRISRSGGRVDLEVLAAEARVARELLEGLLVGLAVVQVVLTPVVASQGVGGIALAACASTLALVRARLHSSPSEALIGVVAGGLGLAVTVAVALWLHEAWRVAGSMVLTGAGGVLLGLQARPSSPSGVLVPPALRGLEAACLVAMPPLLAIVTGAAELLP